MPNGYDMSKRDTEVPIDDDDNGFVVTELQPAAPALRQGAERLVRPDEARTTVTDLQPETS